jgi:hypothetical protein
MNLVYSTIFNVLALLNTEILLCRLMWMLLICALNYFNSSYLTVLTVQDLPVHSNYICASCKSLDLAKIEFTFWQIPQKLTHSCIGNILMYLYMYALIGTSCSINIDDDINKFQYFRRFQVARGFWRSTKCNGCFRLL